MSNSFLDAPHPKQSTRKPIEETKANVKKMCRFVWLGSFCVEGVFVNDRSMYEMHRGTVARAVLWTLQFTSAP